MSFRLVMVVLALAGCARPVGDADAGSDAGPADAGPFVFVEGPMRVATWNLETFPKHRDTVAMVTGLITAENLDVVAVQEITDEAAFMALTDALPDHEGVLAEGDEAIRVGLIYRASRLELVRTDTVFSGEWRPFPRPVLRAILRVRGTDFDFWAYVVHLKANTDPDSQARRAQAVERLRVVIDDQLAAPDGEHEIMVLGDWNDRLTDPAVDNVFQPMLDEPDRFHFLTLDLERAGENTFLPFDTFLDHILFTPALLEAYGDGTTEVRHLEDEVSFYDNFVSDHLPVVAEMERSNP